MWGGPRVPHGGRLPLPPSPKGHRQLWRCPAGRNSTTATAIRLDSARPGWFPPGDVSDEGSGTVATTSRTATRAGSVDPSEQRPTPEAPALDLPQPPHAAHARPPKRVRK